MPTKKIKSKTQGAYKKIVSGKGKGKSKKGGKSR